MPEQSLSIPELACALIYGMHFGLLLATKVAAIPVQEIDVTPSGLSATYVHYGTGTTLTNLEDPNCPKLHPYVNKVFHHEIQDDGTWKTAISNRSIEEAENDSKISARHTDGELADLTTRDVPY
ncbi:hypothetical protein NA56DRAFT_712166 [Hyaloscypha hepaticicola]|uniref:Uncharacterized protein n=1 Tax=Hyaloscypha hepaticicola TaxID=2082293 RepID=A0A2J6PGU5_9HELO|nr:hypothetical protein NA56DRAFT_712166 [Hyaloscypha hepaticicola]